MVAREAGVSRGLLHYYFGSKERLLVEVVRHDCEARIRAMDERIARAHSVDEIVAALVTGLEEFIEGEPGTPGRDLRDALRLAPLGRDPGPSWPSSTGAGASTSPTRSEAKEREGVVSLEAGAASVASMLFALGDGFGIQVLSDPDWDREAAFALGVSLARLIGGRGEKP